MASTSNIFKTACVGLGMIMLSAGSAHAEGPKSLTAAMTDGKTVAVNLTDRMTAEIWQSKDVSSPYMLMIYTLGENDYADHDIENRPTFGNNTAGSKIWLEVPVKNLNKISFSDKTVSSAPVITNDMMTVDLQGRAISFGGVTAPFDLRVIDMNGIEVMNRRVADSCKIDLSAIESGIYLISAGESTLKIRLQ